jgi:multidrug efflux pump subunit AcrA (membrane-fusion protein)
VLYRVDDRPVLLLCGAVPAYRDVHEGDAGRDVRQLNRNLHVPAGEAFTARTKAALEQLQRDKGCNVTGKLSLGDAVFLPRPVRIGKVAGELGGSARPGVRVAQATANVLHVQVDVDASQQGEVKKGDRAEVTLPGNAFVEGTVARLGRVAQVPQGKDADPAAATVPAFISLDDPGAARGLESAPVQVDVTTAGVQGALSVPVTALVGKSGGGLAVEVVRADGRRALVAVRVGLFDDARGRAQVEGDLRPGEHVVVPSS